MAIFSRTKSKARRASEQEALKVEVEEKTTTPDNAPERGRKGKEAMRPSRHDHASAMPPILGPSRPSSSFYNTSNGSSSAHVRSDSFQGNDYLTALNSKQDYSYAHSSSDSGYSSAGPQSRSISRAPTVQREMGCFQISNKPTTHLALGEETPRKSGLSARRPSLQDDATDRSSVNRPKTAESRLLSPSRSLQGMRSYFRPDHGDDTPPALPSPPRFQDARYQRQLQQSMPMRPTSVPPQASRSKSERMSRPPPQCSSSSSGAVLQSSRSAYALRSLAAVPPSSRLPYDWSNQIPSNLDQQLRATPLQTRSPAPSTSNKTPAQTKSRQNEYKPPLSILVGLKVNKRGLILDEEGDPIGELYEGDLIDCVREKADAHGAVLDEHGRVVGRVRTLLREDEETMLRWKASNVEKLPKLHGFPLPPVSASSSAAKSPRSDQPTQTQPGITQKDSSSSLTRLKSSLKRREAIEQDAEATTAPRDSPGSSTVISQGQDSERVFSQQEMVAPRPLQNARSDSLASVPESHSTAGLELSDDGSVSSLESQHELAKDGILRGKRGRASSSARTELTRRNPMSSHARSVSEPMNLTTALPPVPPKEKGKRPLQPNKARLFPTDITTTYAHTQRIGYTTTPTRIQSLPLPAYPGRGLAGGPPGNSPFAGCPIPSMPARRLTTPALPTSSPLGTTSLNTQLPTLRPRKSGTIPLVRSPLGSQGT
jgi:hypothetical protein